MPCYQRRITDNAENFTPAERAYIRNELDRYFTTFPTVAEGLMLRTWKSGPRTGQPKTSWSTFALELSQKQQTLQRVCTGMSSSGWCSWPVIGGRVPSHSGSHGPHHSGTGCGSGKLLLRRESV
jgi:hypothetical protein